MSLFNKRYFAGFLVVLAVECLIAFFVDDRFIRPFVGDYLIMILIYLFCKIWISRHDNLTILMVLLFCYGVEIGQKFNLVALLGWEHSTLARILIGTHYDSRDMLAYSLAALTVYLIKVILRRKHNSAGQGLSDQTISPQTISPQTTDSRH